jgi:hypothetical protein
MQDNVLIFKTKDRKLQIRKSAFPAWGYRYIIITARFASVVKLLVDLPSFVRLRLCSIAFFKTWTVFFDAH